MASFTSNLKLRLSENLTADARYNLEKIDQVGAIFQLDNTQSAVVRSQGDISIRPNDASIGGSGAGGTVHVGDITQPITAMEINGPLKVLASGKYLTISHTNSVSDASLTIDTDEANRLISLGGDLSISGGDLSTSGGDISFIAAGNQIVNLPITNAEVSANAAIAGSKVSPIFGNQLVSSEQGFDIISGAHTTSLRTATSPASGVVPFKFPPNIGSLNAVLITDGAGNTSWSALVGTGTVTSVDMTVPSILTISGNPITTNGTLALGLATQAANLVLAGPSSGPDAAPSFRQLSSDELVAGSTNKFYTISGSSGLSSSGNSLKVDPIVATSKVSPVGNDVVLIADSENGNSLKKILLSDIVNLGGSYKVDWTSGTSIAVTHNLLSQDVIVEVYDKTTFETVLLDSVVRTDVNTVTITSSVAPNDVLGREFRVLVKRI